MPVPCKCCTNPESAALNKFLAAGGTNRATSERFKVSTMSVQRHRVNCLRAPRRTEKPGARREQTDSADSIRFASDADPKALIHRAELLLDDATAICAAAKTDGDARLALQALRECRSSLELLMKADGMLSSDGGTTIDNRTQILAFKELSIGELRNLARLTGGTIDQEPGGC